MGSALNKLNITKHKRLYLIVINRDFVFIYEICILFILFSKLLLYLSYVYIINFEIDSKK